MRMKKGDKLFARVDYKVEGKAMTDQDITDHLAYVESVAKERYFVGGGFSNIDGGLCLFEADNLDAARIITQNDPLIKRGIYKFELFEWDLMVLSEDKSI